MTTRQDLQDKLIDLRLKGMADELGSVIVHAEGHNLDFLNTLDRLADIELEQRFQNAIALRWESAKIQGEWLN